MANFALSDLIFKILNSKKKPKKLQTTMLELISQTKKQSSTASQSHGRVFQTPCLPVYHSKKKLPMYHSTKQQLLELLFQLHPLDLDLHPDDGVLS